MSVSLPISSASSRLRRVRSIRDVDVAGKRILVRADLNVPLADGRVADDTRIRVSLPTLELLRDRGARSITVCSHLGRPTGFDPGLTIAPVEACLRELFDGPLTILENTRFDPGETSNGAAFARALSDGQDLLVQDAFGSVHRAHASTVGVAGLLPAYAGLLLEDELEHLGRLLGPVERPFVVVSGGAKVKDKLGVLAHLGSRADSVLVGGKMAEQLLISNPLGFPVELPVDLVAAPRLDRGSEARVCGIHDMPYGWLGLDIGPETRVRFAEILSRAGTIFWNGPLGVFELPEYAEGTKAIADAIAASGAYSVVGGADSLRALNELGRVGDVSWASTGGGAALELLAGDDLPGVDVIPSA